MHTIFFEVFSLWGMQQHLSIFGESTQNRMLCKHDVIVKPILLQCELHIKNTMNKGGQAMHQAFKKMMFL